MSTVVRKRNANIELLRIVSILMVSMLHALNKGGALPNLVTDPSVNGFIAWTLEMLSVSAVNIFFLISGYFMVKSDNFRVSKVVELVLETLFYTVGALIIGCIVGFVDKGSVDVYYILNSVLPIHMDIFWFITVYLLIYMLSPILVKGVNAISHEQFKVVLGLLLVYECLFKSILPVQLTVDKSGYSLLWGLTVFLTGAYIRLYGIPFLCSVRNGLIVFLVSTLLIYVEDYAIKYVAHNYGHLELLAGISTDYNHIFVYLAAVGLFTAYLSRKEITGVRAKIILFLSPMTLGVYLVQENLPVRYKWMKWLGVNGSVNASLFSFVFHVFLAVFGIFIIGCAIDYVRILLFNLIKKVLTRKA